jgi:predicted Zn-dependent protease
MAVYTGILPVAGSEDGLAVVMGHEIGHVVAHHGTQRMTQQYGVDLVLSLFDIGDYQQLAELATTVALELPYGRAMESEADHIGLVYMARAGYDPRVAVDFWQRMSELGGAGPPEFLSTHPSGETRIEQIQGGMPEALEAWGAAGGGP